MKNCRALRRAFIGSLLSTLLCLSMLVGTTFAWFTDSVTSGNNKIVAGNLDIALSYKNAGHAESDDWSEVTSATTDLFTDVDGKPILWEPGAVAVTYLKLENKGNLALKYRFSIDVKDDKMGSDGAALSQVLKGAVVPLESDFTYDNREDAISHAESQSAESVLTYNKVGHMPKGGDVLYFAMIIYLPKELGNMEAGLLYNTNESLESYIQLKLLATQDTVEHDSFGKDYDEGAELPETEVALMTGSALNKAIKDGVGTTATIDYNVKSIRFCEIDDAPVKLVWNEGTPVDASGKGKIRMFVEDGKDVYVCVQSGTKILFNEDSSDMFSHLYEVTKIDFGDRGLISTANVTKMSSMFANCKALKSLDIAGWDVSSVTKMNSMLGGCPLTSLDLSGWNVSNVSDVSSMFFSCSSLTDLDACLANWDVSSVTTMQQLFWQCKSLTSLDLSGWDVSNVKNMHRMFRECTALTTLNLSGWDVSNVTNMHEMFDSCGKLTTIYADNWDTSKVTDSEKMFSGCTSLSGYSETNTNDATYAKLSPEGYFTKKPA